MSILVTYPALCNVTLWMQINANSNESPLHKTTEHSSESY